MAKYRFRDLVDTSSLQRLTTDLYVATGIPSAIIDRDGEILTAAGWQRICTDFHRKHPDLERDCTASDTALRDGTADGEEYVIYQCPRGLVDACAPVVIEGEQVARVFAGQLFTTPPDAAKEALFRETAKRYGLDEDDYVAAYREVPVLADDRFRPALRFLSGFAKLIAGIGIARLREAQATDRAVAEEWRLATIIRTAMDGFLVADAERRVVDVNETACRILGYPKEELLSLHVSDFEVAMTDEEIETLNRRMAQAGQARFESRHRRKDGQVIDVEVSIQYQPTDGGRFVSFFRDITDCDRAERMLRESEEKFSRAFDRAPLMLAITDLETGRYVEVNQEVVRVSGFSREELVGHTAAEIGWNKKENRERLLGELLARGRIEGMELVFRAKDGRPVLGLVSGEAVKIAGRDCLLTVTTDVTEQRRAEEGFRRYELLARHSRDVILFMEQGTGRLLEANDAAARTYGYTREELLGMDVRTLRAEEARASLAAQMAEAAEHGILFETLHRRKDGTSFPVEVSAQGAMIGQTPTLISVIRDISERKRAEALLQESEEKFSKVFQDAPVMIGIHELETGRYVDANRALLRASGFSREELIGRTATEGGWSTINGQARAKQLLEALRSTGRFDGMEVELRSREGRTIDVLVSGELVRIAGRERVLTTAVDITEKKRAAAEREHLQERLAQSQKMEAIGTLAGGIAHDFNNILGAILGYTELSVGMLPAGSPVRENLQEVLVASLRAKELVQQILAFGRRGERKVTSVDAARLVAEAMKLLVSVIPKTITIEQELDTAACYVLADPTELHQVVMNLCTNAYQAMPAQQGVLRVSVSDAAVNPLEASSVAGLKPGRYVRLVVEDNGCGMDEATRARIFEPYFTTKAFGSGTGLGLALVYGIVTGAGGTISVQSHVGVGTKFTVYLPRHEPKDTAREALAPAAEGGHGNVLVVDDEPAIARLTKRILESLGYTVREVSDPLEAVRLFESDPAGFDVVVTDQTMPGMTGADVATRVMALRPGTPVVMCTGYSDLISEEGAKDLGIVAFLGKPFSRNQLGAAVARALGRLG